MFTPSKSTSPNFVDVTLLNTPEPQATSTVQRKSTLESKFLDQGINEALYKRSTARKGDVTQKSDDSSLGILDNISSFLAEVSDTGDLYKHSENKLDTERELARKLLQRCSDIRTTSLTHDTNKENNVNIQNLCSNVTSSTIVSQGESPNHENDQNESTLRSSVNKTSTVVFEPNEISARSSGLSRRSEKRLSTTSSTNMNGITFDSTAAELMAQFGNEEFRPASEMASQMMADEVSWEQNYSYALPATDLAEKEYLNLSCFSGIIGELDLSVESCSGRKMSVDEFFKRKCGNFGELAGGAVERPSLGLSVNSPKKKNNLVPLVDSTIVTETSSVGSFVAKDKTLPNNSCATKDIEEQSIMSLTSIAQALQDIDSGTPRRLVDQLIMAKKKKKSTQTKEGVHRDTYTVLSSNRKSLPATSSKSIESFEKDIAMLNLSSKLSLDSKIPNETLHLKHSVSSMRSLNSNVDGKTNLKSSYQDPKKNISNGNIKSSYGEDLKSLLEDPKFSLLNYTKERNISPCVSLTNVKHKQEKESVNSKNEETGMKGIIKEENLSYKDKTESFVQDLSNSQGIEFQLNSVVIGKSTEELCSCIVGMPRETDIELLNKSDRWVICSPSLSQVQGDKQNVQLALPKDVILIKPNSEQNAKIAVTVVKMCKPIIAVLNITVSDMVTRSEWIMKHIICFKPEELNVIVTNPSQNSELDFQSIAENDMVALPVTIKNKNSVDICMRLSISQDEPRVFGLENCNEMQRVTLKPQESLTTNVQSKGIIQKHRDPSQRSLQRYDGNLIVQVENGPDDTIIIKEIALKVQVGICKLQLIDTDMPFVVSNKQTKPMSMLNVGDVPVRVFASFVDTDSGKSSRHFTVEPENVHLLPNKTGSFNVTYKSQNPDVSKVHAKIQFTAGNNLYQYSVCGESSTCVEAENEHYARCETPQLLSSASSPSSPHSVISNKSGMSGRNSPLSSVSGSTVAGEKIPIRTTHAALVWNSIKAGKSDIKEFTIRNTSNNKIKLHVTISDNEKNFLFVRDRQTGGTSMVLVLQGLESRTISVVFNPHNLGAATGKIVFKHYEPRRDDSESRPSKVLFLYGYGGYSRLEISEAFKDTSGKMWLSLGTLNSVGSLNARLRLQNNGDLCSYVKIKLIPKAVYPSMVSSWHVNPTELILNSKETQWVTLEFNPRKEDLALLQRSAVSHVGTILIINGDEPTRWRIRRLYNKMRETGELTGNENEAFQNIVHPICKAFPGEQMMRDINTIRDSLQNLGDLCRGIRQHEIMLTMEVCADETLSVLQHDADESQMFYSLCSDNSHIYEGNGESFLPSETLLANSTFQHALNVDNFIVAPSTVILTPPTKMEAIVTIKTTCTVAQVFETALSNTEYLSVVPAEGMIPTRRDFQLKVHCKRKVDRSFNAVLEIYTENNKLDVQIKVNVKRM
ncbi:spindle defective 2 isoform X1 [Halictus rubicundus]|uniref:spindle defective 2 isoform X1 n=1 Tax=Halictus rubicundus TaxID=77578 RepID=UPI004035DA7F